MVGLAFPETHYDYSFFRMQTDAQVKRFDAKELPGVLHSRFLLIFKKF